MGSSAVDRIKIQLSCQAGYADNYCAALWEAGSEPAAGCCPAPDLSCGGLVLCGGGDIESTQYGQPDRGSQPPDRERDRAELALFHAFREAGRPILGICRGMQLINVALGGTLIQDLPQAQGVFHGGGPSDRVHPVRAEEDGTLHQLYGPVFSVNSAHHQAVDRLGRGLRVSAWAESGFPEAIELPGSPLLGVQFHPERMAFERRRADTVDGAAIFAWFLNQCQRL